MEIIHRDGLARIGKFDTPHGSIETPTILPVINPNIPALSIGEMVALGSQGFITNSYIIRRTEKLREKAEKNGVHSLIGYDGPVMTDSGTFQSHVYSDIEYSNAEIVNFQRKIGSDISTILDIFSEPDFSYEKAKMAVLETHARMQELPRIDDTILAGPIQGSTYGDLRKLSAELMSSSQAGYLPIGGVVPLLENYRYDILVDVIINSKIHADFSKPVHLFGGGHPMFLGMAVLLGVDVFDSASYVKYARSNRMLFLDGSRELSRISSLPGWSALYGKINVSELKEAPPEERSRLLALHNLSAIFTELNEIKERIFQQNLWQYVEAKARTHPYLFRAYLKILEYSGTLEKYEDLSKKSSFFYFDHYTDRNPFLLRLKKHTEAVTGNDTGKCTVLSEDHWHPGRPHPEKLVNLYEHSGKTFLLKWQNQLVPIELDDTYPVEQIISSGNFTNYADDMCDGSPSPFQNQAGAFTRKDLNAAVPESDYPVRSFDLEKVRKIADFQFGMGAGKIIFPEGCRVTRSRSTGRIRGIFHEEKLIATQRAHDGFFTLSVDGARMLHSSTSMPKHRVVVTNDTAEFNARGFNVFFKFVVGNDPDILAGNEVLVVDENDTLVAVGKSVTSGSEIHFFKSGVAVKVHRGVQQGTEKSTEKDEKM